MPRRKSSTRRPYAAFGAWLAELRRARGLTQQDVADFLKRSQPHIGHIERGTWLPGAEIRAHLAKLYQVDYKAMVGRIAQYGIREQVMLLKTEGYQVPAATPAPSTESSWTTLECCGTIHCMGGVAALVDANMDTHMDVYRLRVTGDALQPLVRAGDELILSTAVDATVGDRVVIHDAIADESFCGEVVWKRGSKVTVAPLSGDGDPVSLTLSADGVWCGVWVGLEFRPT